MTKSLQATSIYNPLPELTFFTLTNMKIFLPFLFFLSVFNPAYSKEKVEIGKFLDWNGISRVEIIEPFKLAEFKAIIANPINVNEIALPSASNNTFEAVLEAKTKFNARFFGTFRKELSGIELRESDSLAVPPEPILAQEKNGGGNGNRLLLKTQLIDIDPGSAAKRMWLGSGRASIKLAGELINLETSKTVVKFQHTVEGRGGPFSSMSYDKLLRELTEEMAEEVAEFISSFN